MLLRTQCTMMKDRVGDFDPSHYRTLDDLMTEYRALSGEIRQEIVKNAVMNQNNEFQSQAPPLYVILVSRGYLGFLMDEPLLDFHLNWIEWAGPGGDQTPTLKKYLVDKNLMLEKIDAMIADPVCNVSSMKIIKLRRFESQHCAHFEEVPKHIKVWSTVVLYSIFMQLTIRVVERCRNLDSKGLECRHHPKTKKNMVETLRDSQRKVDVGEQVGQDYKEKKIHRM
jgi:hypothetical protein